MWSVVRDVLLLLKLHPPVILLCLVRFFRPSLFDFSNFVGSTFAVSLVSLAYNELVTFLRSFPKSLDFLDSLDFSRGSFAPYDRFGATTDGLSFAVTS